MNPKKPIIVYGSSIIKLRDTVRKLATARKYTTRRYVSGSYFKKIELPAITFGIGFCKVIIVEHVDMNDKKLLEFTKMIATNTSMTVERRHASALRINIPQFIFTMVDEPTWFDERTRGRFELIASS